MRPRHLAGIAAFLAIAGATAAVGIRLLESRQTSTPASVSSAAPVTPVPPPVTVPTAPMPPADPPAPPRLAAEPQEPLLFRAFLDGLWPEAASAGVSRATFDAALALGQLDQGILELLDNQPEHVRSVGEYVALLVSEERIANGRARLAELQALAERIEAAYGVDRHILIAIWGIESNYGAAMGRFHVPQALATLALKHERRAPFWRSELIQALRILERGDIPASDMNGSWAGAMGHTQFIPSTYNAHAVDFDGDGRRDIWGTVADALASTANYLKVSGWRPRQPWGLEVLLPDGFDVALSAPGGGRPLARWAALGLRATDGAGLPDHDGTWALQLPMGVNGPAFLVGDGFRAIIRYNNSLSYALSVGHLADRIAGGNPLLRSWPPEKGLARAEREELQRLLTARGFEPGGTDGVLGNQTRAAVRAFQRANGLPQDGYPGRDLLDLLRSHKPT